MCVFFFQTTPLSPAGMPVSDRPFTRTSLLGFVGPVSLNYSTLCSHEASAYQRRNQAESIQFEPVKPKKVSKQVSLFGSSFLIAVEATVAPKLEGDAAVLIIPGGLEMFLFLKAVGHLRAVKWLDAFLQLADCVLFIRGRQSQVFRFCYVILPSLKIVSTFAWLNFSDSDAPSLRMSFALMLFAAFAPFRTAWCLSSARWTG